MRRTQRGVAVGMGIKRIRWDLKNENDLVTKWIQMLKEIANLKFPF